MTETYPIVTQTVWNVLKESTEAQREGWKRWKAHVFVTLGNVLVIACIAAASLYWWLSGTILALVYSTGLGIYV